MKAHCFGCGVEKDLEVLETSPFADEDGLVDEPISPLMILDCQGPDEFRMVVVCHTCFHALSPDMWIGKDHWEAISPKVPYDRLPMYVEGQDDPTLLKPLS